VNLIRLRTLKRSLREEEEGTWNWRWWRFLYEKWITSNVWFIY